jgi:hypothetical protein
MIIIVPEENGSGAQERTIVEGNEKEQGEEAGGHIYKYTFKLSMNNGDSTDLYTQCFETIPNASQQQTARRRVSVVENNQITSCVYTRSSPSGTLVLTRDQARLLPL